MNSAKPLSNWLLGSWIHLIAFTQVRLRLHLEAKAIRLKKPHLLTYFFIPLVWHSRWFPCGAQVLLYKRIPFTGTVHPSPALWVLAANRSQVSSFSKNGCHLGGVMSSRRIHAVPKPHYNPIQEPPMTGLNWNQRVASLPQERITLHCDSYPEQHPPWIRPRLDFNQGHSPD